MMQIRTRWSIVLLLLGLVSWASAASVPVYSEIHEDFEDGSHTGRADRMRVPPKLVTEDGNTFLRITASRGDCASIPSSYCQAGRNRSGVQWTGPWHKLPLINASNMRQTYSARIRFVTTTGQTGSDGKFFSLSGYAPGGEGGYGTSNGTGPNLSLWRGPVDVMKQLTPGDVGGYAPYDNERKATYFDIGPVPQNTWHTYRVDAVWSHNPQIGRLDIYLDGVKKQTIAGRDIFLGPTCNRLPAFKTGHYGDFAYGVYDVDDVHVSRTKLAGEPHPPAPKPCMCPCACP